MRRGEVDSFKNILEDSGTTDFWNSCSNIEILTFIEFIDDNALSLVECSSNYKYYK